MRFAVHSFNGGVAFLEQEKIDPWRQLLELVAASAYQMQGCGERKRVGEPIFSPSMNNATLRAGFAREGWLCGVPLLTPTPASGRDVDFYKQGVVVEAQFSHYGLLQGDFARMEGLYTGPLALRGGLSVECGVVIVVNRAMPTSQSVSRADQAVGRAAPLAPTIPVAVVDVLPPEASDVVDFHDEVVARARRAGVIRQVPWGELVRAWRQLVPPRRS